MIKTPTVAIIEVPAPGGCTHPRTFMKKIAAATEKGTIAHNSRPSVNTDQHADECAYSMATDDVPRLR